MSKLSEGEEHTLRQTLAAMELFTAEDRDMPIQMVRLFLLAALNEGLGTKDLAAKAGLPVSVASRHLIDLAERDRYGDQGREMVVQKVGIENRRTRPTYLTAKGRGKVAQLHRIFGGRGACE
jgi:DNA-binding MarR family transcriptional regulator